MISIKFVVSFTSDNENDFFSGFVQNIILLFTENNKKLNM